jgi:Na+/H+ antiporter NhaD/arsenite permease-like protein
VGRFTLKIWQVMLLGALAVLLTGQISVQDALRSVNTDVMVFLFCMFVIGEALVAGGYLENMAHRLFHRAKNPAHLLLAIILSMGILSAILMNDTLAIIGTPLMLALARRHGLSEKTLLLALAFAITTGSVMSPIGNPQNLLVAAISGMPSPFVTFALYLCLPTILGLLAVYVMLRSFFPEDFSYRPLVHSPPVSSDSRAMRICRCSLAVLLLLILAKPVLALAGYGAFLPLPVIALCGAAPVLLFSKDRVEIVKRIDWYTLVFFAAMFVLMASVWQTGFFQEFFSGGSSGSISVILASSIIVSQFISNVPFVALFAPVILKAGGTTVQVAALAAGSTIAGNATILGAASNVIIVQNAEKEGATVTFLEFARVGLPLTIIQAVIYWGFLSLV